MSYTGEKKRAYDRAWMKARREQWIEDHGAACVKCGSVDRLEIDHIDPSTKIRNVATLWSYTEEKRNKELAKCQILCHDCHAIKTASEGEVSHGTHGRYTKHHCRCLECKAAHAKLARETRAAGKKW